VILTIDTSGAIMAAIVDGDAVVAERFEFAPRGHAELLAAMVQEVVHDAGVQPERIVVGTGPATFTGLRVGLVTARTLGYAWGVPVEGLCSLDAIGVPSGMCTVVTDARRREVYWARYEGGIRVAGPEVALPGDVVVAGRVLGRGALLYPDVFVEASSADPTPLGLVEAARVAAASGSDMATEPLYLRRPDVHGVPGA
jgi:tRNA threonylcarbamoyladenosine biosynthesis protein TsaB